MTRKILIYKLNQVRELVERANRELEELNCYFDPGETETGDQIARNIEDMAEEFDQVASYLENAIPFVLKQIESPNFK